MLPLGLATATRSGTGLTIAYWFKGTSTQSAVRIQSDANTFIVAGWNGLHIILSDGGAAGGIALGAAATNGNWHHIAVTWKQGGNFTSYLDGVQVASRAVGAATLPVLNSGMRLGAFNGGSEFMNGSLDEVRVFNVALSQTQIQNTMNCELQSTGNSGLLAYYKFNKGTSYTDNTALNTTLPDASGFAYNGTLTNFALTGATSNWISGSAVTAGNTCSVAIPVELLSFEGKNTEGGNLLTWTTASEVNNKGFDVERSMGSGDWETLGFVKGNNKGSTYQFTDRRDAMHRVSTTTNYYRLRQIDNDGKETLSKVIAIRQSIGKNNLKIYPNPTSTVLTIEHAPSVETIEIVNPLGQVIKTIQVNLETLQTDITTTELTNGIYFLRVNRSEMIRFVKI